MDHQRPSLTLLDAPVVSPDDARNTARVAAYLADFSAAVPSYPPEPAKSRAKLRLETPLSPPMSAATLITESLDGQGVNKVFWRSKGRLVPPDIIIFNV